ncbi:MULTISPECIES: hypothetical protein [Priestia]|nr:MULTISPECIES: hypothetical protein [Priestia]
MKKLQFKEIELEELNSKSLWAGIAIGAAAGAAVGGAVLVLT